MVCPKCYRENKNSNIRCEECGFELINENSMNNFYTITNNNTVNDSNVINISPGISKIFLLIFLFFFYGPFVLAGLFFCGAGITNVIKERKLMREYTEASGVLVEYVECSSDSCLGLYSYEVNGVSYKVKNDVSTNTENIKKNVLIYYDVDNPEEAFVKTSFWYFLVLVGVLIIVFPLIPFLIFFLMGRKAKKKVDLSSNEPIRV